MGPKKIKSIVLSEAEEEAIMAFRQLIYLSLDDVGIVYKKLYLIWLDQAFIRA